MNRFRRPSPADGVWCRSRAQEACPHSPHRWHDRRVPVTRRLPKGCALAVTLALYGCGARSELEGPCRPAIPEVGTSEHVDATAVARLAGYIVHLGGRDWQAPHVATYPTPVSGRARVVAARPVPNVQMKTSTGVTLTFTLVPEACA